MTEKWKPSDEFEKEVNDLQKEWKLWVKDEEEDDGKDYSFLDDLLGCNFSKKWSAEEFMKETSTLTENDEIKYYDIWKHFCA